MKLHNKKGQTMVEFIVLVPILFAFLIAVTQLTTLAIKAQKLDMAAYYGARLYSKKSFRGIKKGTVMMLEQKKQDLLGLILHNVSLLLETNEVYIDILDENTLVLTWPVYLNIFGIIVDYVLVSKADMENEPLEYGGGRYYDQREMM